MPLPVKVCTVSQFCCAYDLRMSYQLTFINRHRSIASPTRSNMTPKNAIFPRIVVSCPPRKVNTCESSMQTLLFAMSGEHVGPFVRVPRAHHTIQEKRVWPSRTLRVPRRSRPARPAGSDQPYLAPLGGPPP